MFDGARITPAGSPFPSAAGQKGEAKNSGEQAFIMLTVQPWPNYSDRR
ncbi:hypothetical protein [Kitasatospora sp. DSM 101779]|nr:hypothetical protein [Kitasatospora sp. DSM 101779]MCU7827039.1 hypothetical protein [Kitasatospora sp. DSM 101779]